VVSLKYSPLHSSGSVHSSDPSPEYTFFTLSSYHIREYKDFSRGKMREIENISKRKRVKNKHKIVENINWRLKYKFRVKNVLSLVLGGEMGA